MQREDLKLRMDYILRISGKLLPPSNKIAIDEFEVCGTQR